MYVSKTYLRTTYFSLCTGNTNNDRQAMHTNTKPQATSAAAGSEIPRIGELANSNLFPFLGMQDAMPAIRCSAICDWRSRFRFRFPECCREFAFFARFSRLCVQFVGFNESIMISLICHSRASSMSAVRVRILHRLWNYAHLPSRVYAGMGPYSMYWHADTDTDTDSLSPPLPCSLEQLHWQSYQCSSSGDPRDARFTFSQ